jgi:hypothetical protein
MKRRLYPQEIVILALTFGVLLTFWLATGRWLLLIFGLGSAGLGAVCVVRPEWLVYGDKTPERLERERMGCRVRGFMLLSMGVVLLLFCVLSRHGR